MNRKEVLLLLRRVVERMLWILGVLWPPVPQGVLTIGELYRATAYQERKQHDALPGRLPQAFYAFAWIQNYRAMPQVSRRRHPCDEYRSCTGR